MMQRTNAFAKIYSRCNTGSNSGKWQQLLDEGRTVPLYIDLELTNHCNIHCYMCPVGTCEMQRSRGFISMNIVDKVCDELSRSPIQGVRLIRWGEPTLHPQFLEILQRLKATGKIVHFNTNGTLLDCGMIQRIIDMEIDSVKFSFQGVDKASYEEMRCGSSWDKLLENIQLMNVLRGDKQKPYIQISTTTTTETKEQIDSFLTRMAPLCDYINVGRTELCHLNVELMNISGERKQKFLQLKSQENLPKKHFKVCPEVYDKLSVNWDGTVTACCADYDNMLIVGDLNAESLQEIYQGERIHKIREIISRNSYDEIPLCRTCFECIS